MPINKTICPPSKACKGVMQRKQRCKPEMTINDKREKLRSMGNQWKKTAMKQKLEMTINDEREKLRTTGNSMEENHYETRTMAQNN
jgi:hypothetical protein